MRRNGLRILGLLLVLILVGSVSATDGFRYPVMRPDFETMALWQHEYETAPKAKLDAAIGDMLAQAEALNSPTSMDLLDHIDYDPVQRDQGICANCWVWAGTGVMEIAHDVEDGVLDRLSIQYLNSCMDTHWACCGGSLGNLATWYTGQGLSVPWANTNADFADGWRECADGSSLRACGDITTIPNYPIITISAVTIETSTGQATAIANIKNILNQGRGVYFSFRLPEEDAWDDFFEFWDGEDDETEATLWDDVDDYCGDEWEEDEDGAGSHAVLIVGYNDDDDDPDNHYWLVLNSWGTAGGVRPNGLFRVPTQMDYDCTYPGDDNDENWTAFRFWTLDVDFGNALPVADAHGPYPEDCEGTTTTVELDGSGSIDLEDDALDFLWTTDCPGGSFDDATSATPVLTVDTSPGCSVECEVTLTVTDDDGATDLDTAAVTIKDDSPPLVSVPADLAVECDASTEPADTGTATATDACDPAPVVTYADVEAPGACPQAKTISRTWTATDSCGYTDTAVQTIEVVDTTAPVLSLPADVTIECDESEHPDNTGYATATDNCDGTPVVTYADVEIAGGCAQEKTIQRTWTATDVCGNSSQGIQTIEVEDTTAPVLSLPADVTIEYGESEHPDKTGYATAIDNCDGTPVVSYKDDEIAGGCALEKTIQRIWTAADARGNSSQGMQTIEVVETTPPVIACNAPMYVSPPQAPITFVATATDNCDADPVEVITGYECYKFSGSGRLIDKSDSCVVEIADDSITLHNMTGVGTFIAWDVFATDASGNEARQSCEVEVVRHTSD